MRHLWLLVAIAAALLLRSAHAAEPIAYAPNSTIPPAPVVVGIVDSGINLAHSHFANTVITTYNATDGLNASAFDVCLHGTGMAGIVIDQNPAVELLIIQASYMCRMRQDHTVNAINYAAERGAQIINISSGGTYDYPPMREAISNAVASGVLVVVSAGNSGDDTPFYPAAYAPAMTVAAYDLDVSSFGAWIDVSAQGMRVRAPLGESGYLYANGTSASAAIVSGMASYIWSQQPDLTLDEMTAILMASLVDVEPPGFDERTGYGRADTRRLHEALGVRYVDVPWLAVGGTPVAAPALESVWLEPLEIVAAGR
jgi:subtilisin family serine protease